MATVDDFNALFGDLPSPVAPTPVAEGADDVFRALVAKYSKILGVIVPTGPKGKGGKAEQLARWMAEQVATAPAGSQAEVHQKNLAAISKATESVTAKLASKASSLDRGKKASLKLIEKSQDAAVLGFLAGKGVTEDLGDAAEIFKGTTLKTKIGRALSKELGDPKSSGRGRPKTPPIDPAAIDQLKSIAGQSSVSSEPDLPPPPEPIVLGPKKGGVIPMPAPVSPRPRNVTEELGPDPTAGRFGDRARAPKSTLKSLEKFLFTSRRTDVPKALRDDIPEAMPLARRPQQALLQLLAKSRGISVETLKSEALKALPAPSLAGLLGAPEPAGYEVIGNAPASALDPEPPLSSKMGPVIEETTPQVRLPEDDFRVMPPGPQRRTPSEMLRSPRERDAVRERLPRLESERRRAAALEYLQGKALKMNAGRDKAKAIAAERAAVKGPLAKGLNPINPTPFPATGLDGPPMPPAKPGGVILQALLGLKPNSPQAALSSMAEQPGLLSKLASTAVKNPLKTAGVGLILDMLLPAIVAGGGTAIYEGLGGTTFAKQSEYDLASKAINPQDSLNAMMAQEYQRRRAAQGLAQNPAMARALASEAAAADAEETGSVPGSYRLTGSPAPTFEDPRALLELLRR